MKLTIRILLLIILSPLVIVMEGLFLIASLIHFALSGEWEDMGGKIWARWHGKNI